MKTLFYAIFLVAAFSAQADPRRPSEAEIIAAHESEAVAIARQRPDVIRLRASLTAAATEAERKAITSALYAIMAQAAAQGRQAGLAAVAAKRQSDAEMHRRWDEERRHRDLIQAINNLNLRR